MSDNDTKKLGVYQHYTPNNGWVKDFFETVATQVYMGDGSTVEEKAQELNENITDVAVKGFDNEGRIDVLEEYVDQTKNKIYSHVGMIIQSTTLNTMSKVIAIYGGTRWERIQGAFLFGANSSIPVNTTGGETMVKLTEDQIPAHKHDNGLPLIYSGQENPGACLIMNDSEGRLTFQDRVAVYASQTNYTKTTGGGGYHNNMPPYKAVYIWERTV